MTIAERVRTFAFTATMPAGLRDFALTAHITSSVGWVGAVMAYLALVAGATTSKEPQTVRAAWIAMELIGWSALVPLAIASFVTGLIQSLGTPWGLFRHYWVIFKLLLTVFATVILLEHMPTVSHFAAMEALTDSARIGGLSGERLHAGGGLVVLLITTILSVYKPRGVTPYGWRRQQTDRARAMRRAEATSRPV